MSIQLFISLLKKISKIVQIKKVIIGPNWFISLLFWFSLKQIGPKPQKQSNRDTKHKKLQIENQFLRLVWSLTTDITIEGIRKLSITIFFSS